MAVPSISPAVQLGRARALAELALGQGQGKTAEVLGSGPEAAPKVVEVMQQLGVA